MAFIDSDSNLHQYPSSNETYSDTYSAIYNTNYNDGNIDGQMYTNSTADACAQKCNSLNECAGYVFDNNNNNCYLKNNNMYNGDSYNISGVDTFYRNKMPKNPPKGVSINTTNIDTIKYNSYNDGGEITDKYGIASVNRGELTHLQNKLNVLASQISNLTGKFGYGTNSSENQANKNNIGINKYIDDIKNTNNQIKSIANDNTQNVLKDSSIVVTQKNYDYIFWSILAAGTILLSIRILKNQ